ncbi:hypothetical protein LOTGIDRAFT_174944 [Lottia gigantea]|uniref:Uncharacterized protein n=1 Tax=Lottia gigantea TaxID=225164 RepID=V3ZXH1_LOTGI|nr:hypothetical protein LOTGIDRAFT_174944 [Lottia gigantea]ESO96233.1 hypothetical protein LOTGIDRAFT_174944 [Lottia gigantea]
MASFKYLSTATSTLQKLQLNAIQSIQQRLSGSQGHEESSPLLEDSRFVSDRGMIQVDGEKFFIGPMKMKSSFNSDNIYNVDNVLNNQHIIYTNSDQNHTHTSYCHLKENFKHKRLKRSVQDLSSVNRHFNSIIKSRHKRSDSLKRYVETLVVADKLMLDYHGSDAQHYVLTLMAMSFF